MTKAQVELLKAVMESEAKHWKATIDRDFPLPKRAVEVGKLFGVDPRTAKSLVEAGLLEYVGSDNPRQTWVQSAYDVLKERWRS